VQHAVYCFLYQACISVAYSACWRENDAALPPALLLLYKLMRRGGSSEASAAAAAAAEVEVAAAPVPVPITAARSRAAARNAAPSSVRPGRRASPEPSGSNEGADPAVGPMPVSMLVRKLLLLRLLAARAAAMGVLAAADAACAAAMRRSTS